VKTTHLRETVGQSKLGKMHENVGQRDALYLFVCHLEWCNKGNLAAYQELLAALDDENCDIRNVAEVLLQRASPRPRRTERSLEARSLEAK